MFEKKMKLFFKKINLKQQKNIKTNKPHDLK